MRGYNHRQKKWKRLPKLLSSDNNLAAGVGGCPDRIVWTSMPMIQHQCSIKKHLCNFTCMCRKQRPSLKSTRRVGWQQVPTASLPMSYTWRVRKGQKTMLQTPVQDLTTGLPARLSGRVNFVWKREQTCEQAARDKEGKAEREAATVSDGRPPSRI